MSSTITGSRRCTAAPQEPARSRIRRPSTARSNLSHTRGPAGGARASPARPAVDGALKPLGQARPRPVPDVNPVAVEEEDGGEDPGVRPLDDTEQQGEGGGPGGAHADRAR